jgi:hypothetical protein
MPEEEKFVPAERFRRMDNTGILVSIDNAIRVLEGRGVRTMTDAHAAQALDMASRLTDLVSTWIRVGVFAKSGPKSEHEAI